MRVGVLLRLCRKDNGINMEFAATTRETRLALDLREQGIGHVLQ